MGWISEEIVGEAIIVEVVQRVTTKSRKQTKKAIRHETKDTTHNLLGAQAHEQSRNLGHRIEVKAA